jgi:polyisoprenoid-binding protein YceI
MPVEGPARIGHATVWWATFAGETFDGSTPKVDGYAFWKSADLEKGIMEGSDLHFEVDLNSLNTGIGLRNNHRKGNYLDTKKYPFAAFKGRIVKAARAGDADSLVNAEGVLTIHGTDKPLAVTGRVSVNGDRYHLSCVFPLHPGGDEPPGLRI